MTSKEFFQVVLQVASTKEVILCAIGVLLFINFVIFVAKYKKKPPKIKIKRIKPAPAPKPPKTENQKEQENPVADKTEHSQKEDDKTASSHGKKH